MPKKNEIGQRFGRLTVRSGEPSVKGRSMWLCDCECGREVVVCGPNLRKGMTQSCGCLQRERTSAAAKTHGCSRGDVAEYRIWKNMHTRCLNPNAPCFADYGARGISICDRWRTSFEAFMGDMGPRPSKRHTIDRFPNNDGNYEPGNCRWATMAQQATNRRNTVTVTLNGVTKPLVTWCREIGIPYTTARKRLNRGVPADEALTPYK